MQEREELFLFTFKLFLKHDGQKHANAIWIGFIPPHELKSDLKDI